MQDAWKQVREEDAIQSEKEKRWFYIALIIGCGLYAAFVYERFQWYAQKKAQSERIAFVESLAELPNMEAIERRLADQKGKLSITATNVALLRDEMQRLIDQKNELVSAMKADRETLDAVFALQQRRNQATASRDLTISFFLGVLGSLIATYLFLGIAKVQKRLSRVRYQG